MNTQVHFADTLRRINRRMLMLAIGIIAVAIVASTFMLGLWSLTDQARVQARVLIEHKPDVVLVQRGPFFDEDGGRYAFVVRDGIAERRPVKFGATSLEAIEILDGLKPGERIVIAGTDAFEDAERIRVGQ